MQSTDLEEIKAALWEQAYHPCTQVKWGVAQVMAVRKNRGQLVGQLRGRGRWHAVEVFSIGRALVCSTSACDLGEVSCAIFYFLAYSLHCYFAYHGRVLTCAT